MKSKIAIIGAGISGVSAALELAKFSDVTIFEKARGYGGRMSTRTREEYQFNHGTQYFTAENKNFHSLINKLQSKNIVKSWCPKIVSIKKHNICNKVNIEEKLYVPTPKMSTLCRYLASDLNVNLNIKVDRVVKHDKWTLYQDKELLGHFDWVIFSIPSHQVIEIAPSDFCYLDEISHITMQACYALMIGTSKSLDINWDAAYVHGFDINWVTVNSLKPNRPKATAILAHSTNLWAANHLDETDVVVKRHLVKELSSIMDVDLLSSEHIDIHRWRYAKAAKQTRSQKGYVDLQNQLAACGDWCIEGNIEAGFDSGYDTANKIKKML